MLTILPLPALAHVQPEEPAAEVGAFEVDGDVAVEVGFGEVVQWGFEVDGGVVEEDVDAAEAFDGGVADALDAVLGGDVGLNGQRVDAEGGEVLDGVAGFLGGGAVVDDDVGAAFGQAGGDVAANAARAAGDDDGGALQVHGFPGSGGGVGPRGVSVTSYAAAGWVDVVVGCGLL